MVGDYPKFHHEDLDSYKVAIELLALAAGVVERYPRGYGPLADELKRASLSIPPNIAEGYGKRSATDRARLYDIARASAHGCGAVFDASKVLGFLDDATYTRGKTLLHRIVSMLVRLAGCGPSLSATATATATATGTDTDTRTATGAGAGLRADVGYGQG